MDKNYFLAHHSKSSDIFISLVVHAVVIFLASFFVAVTVTQKDEVDFES